MLLEGGLRWQALSLTPADMDFINLKAAAAREIALAFGVPPMLLGLPGDKHLRQLQRGQTARLWRLTILPLADKIIDALALRARGVVARTRASRSTSIAIPALASDRTGAVGAGGGCRLPERTTRSARCWASGRGARPDAAVPRRKPGPMPQASCRTYRTPQTPGLGPGVRREQEGTVSMTTDTESALLARLVEQGRQQGADLLTLRAMAEEASELGAARALERLGLADTTARAPISDELRELLSAWRDAKRTARDVVVSWVVRVLLAALMLGLAVRLGLVALVRG